MRNKGDIHFGCFGNTETIIYFCMYPTQKVLIHLMTIEICSLKAKSRDDFVLVDLIPNRGNQIHATIAKLEGVSHQFRTAFKVPFVKKENRRVKKLHIFGCFWMNSSRSKIR